MTDDRPDRPEKPGDAGFPETTEELRADRDLTREELEETLAELTGKLDVPARAEARIHDAEARIHDTAQTAKDRTTAAGRHALDAAANAKAKASEVISNTTNPTPSIAEPLDDVGKHAGESLRRRRVPIAIVGAASAAVITWAILRRRRA
ncbi:MAG TPA: DUF3618 domain-containing protein [Nocardia sp.]|uniref:DUF3618 domain-containing protein n=1 Tax=Nocardia TaxID=1817 RepID=UPI0024541D15|nr:MULTISPECIES: DUF3618 domain-containing protein [Nocardia]HLS76156.1 DUF3618 domain-containing protein [Nocardia sp.]